MQVTPEMIQAAREAVPTAVISDAGIAAVIGAALRVMPKSFGGFIPGPSPRGDSILAKLSDGSCTFTLPKTPTQGPLPPGTTITFSPIGDIGDVVEALTCLMGKRTSEPIPVTEPRPGSTIDDIATVFAVNRRAVLEWIADRNAPGVRPGHHFPKPVLDTGDVERDLYDLDAVKAWYGGMPQATDE